ncbi:MAG: acetylglutamate kinase [Candidatus Pelagibacter sp. TMED275]|nr:MAG: acetylglutamate kinase [Candidatus Pelagibacter sp. TMED275]|tara:strand:- start:350 stop:1198 length:849 start_codon:yes stop_codon:yes gene_type:complete
MELDKILPKNGPSKEEVSKYLDKYKNEYIVIKCGGSVLNNPKLFEKLIQDIIILKKLEFNPIIIHGGGKKINTKLDSKNIKSKFIKGLRVTKKEIIDIVKEVLIDFNKEIVETFKNFSCKAESFTSDNNSILLVEPADEELEFVGVPIDINIKIIDKTTRENIIPVIAPLGLSKKGQVYNINADTAAGAISKNLKARRLLILSDVEGVLDKNNKLIPEINSVKANDLITKGIVSEGMIPKINNCIDVASNGVKGVVIIDGRKSHSILFELLSDKGAGTLIRK